MAINRTDVSIEFDDEGRIAVSESREGSRGSTRSSLERIGLALAMALLAGPTAADHSTIVDSKDSEVVGSMRAGLEPSPEMKGVPTPTPVDGNKMNSLCNCRIPGTK